MRERERERERGGREEHASGKERERESERGRQSDRGGHSEERAREREAGRERERDGGGRSQERGGRDRDRSGAAVLRIQSGPGGSRQVTAVSEPDRWVAVVWVSVVVVVFGVGKNGGERGGATLAAQRFGLCGALRMTLCWC